MSDTIKNKSLWNYLEVTDVYYKDNKECKLTFVGSYNKDDIVNIEIDNIDEPFHFKEDCKYRTDGNTIYLTDIDGDEVMFVCYESLPISLLEYIRRTKENAFYQTLATNPKDLT